MVFLDMLVLQWYIQALTSFGLRPSGFRWNVGSLLEPDWPSIHQPTPQAAFFFGWDPPKNPLCARRGVALVSKSPPRKIRIEVPFDQTKTHKVYTHKFNFGEGAQFYSTASALYYMNLSALYLDGPGLS